MNYVIKVYRHRTFIETADITVQGTDQGVPATEINRLLDSLRDDNRCGVWKTIDPHGRTIEGPPSPNKVELCIGTITAEPEELKQ